ncbi:MAG: transcriptional regulator [Planctomycetaceae bacterium]
MSKEHPQRLLGCSVLPPMNPRPATANNSPKSKPKKRATGDRFSTINAFVDCSLADLTRAEALTWIVLWRDTKNGIVRTSMTDVARRIGTTRRAVVDAVAKLEKRGLLIVVFRGGMERGINVYRVQPLMNLAD